MNRSKAIRDKRNPASLAMNSIFYERQCKSWSWNGVRRVVEGFVKLWQLTEQIETEEVREGRTCLMVRLKWYLLWDADGNYHSEN